MSAKIIPDILLRVRRSATKKILFLPHAIRQMSRSDRMITATEVTRAIRNGKIIEDYPNDPRGHSCPILGFGKGKRPIHVVCSPKPDFLSVITAYIPSSDEWGDLSDTRILL